MRDLTRYRQSLVAERSRFANRLQKVLEDTNLKLTSVVSDIQGVSAQAILRALVAGQTDPAVLAEMAKGRLRRKRTELAQALVGQFREHHRWLIAELLTHLDFLDEQLAQLEAHIEAQVTAWPALEAAATLLDTIPGVDHQMALLVLAEIGLDMGRFPSDRHLTAWAGLAPGNNETGGKARSGRTRKGNRYLQRSLVLAAHGAVRKKSHYLRSLYYRLAARRGGARATVAVARTILQIAYHMLKRNEPYHELGEHYLDQVDRERTAKRLIRRLQSIGYVVALEGPTAVAATSPSLQLSSPPLCTT